MPQQCGTMSVDTDVRPDAHLLLNTPSIAQFETSGLQAPKHHAGLAELLHDSDSDLTKTFAGYRWLFAALGCAAFVGCVLVQKGVSSSNALFANPPTVGTIRPSTALYRGRGRRGKKGGGKVSKGRSDIDGVDIVLDRGQMREAKYCEQCGKVMTWRKKWKKNWAEVKYCSERCRRAKGSKGGE